jgi:hypothetical protein
MAMHPVGLGQVMAAPGTRPFLRNPNRRTFLWSLASLGLTTKIATSEESPEPAYRLLTPEGKVRMSVRYFASSTTDSFHFRDDLTKRVFCLSANGEEKHGCLERFVGSMAIACYDFRSRHRSQTPLNLRERVVTIDQDNRMSPRAPYESVLAVERDVASDVQAFGYDPGDASAKPLTVWRLLRQDLYLNDRTTAFLIVHWKHTLKLISLVDVIPGDGTELIR